MIFSIPPAKLGHTFVTFVDAGIPCWYHSVDLAMYSTRICLILGRRSSDLGGPNALAIDRKRMFENEYNVTGACCDHPDSPPYSHKRLCGYNREGERSKSGQNSDFHGQDT